MRKTVVASAVAANTPFVITVPGQERWTILAVRAVCSTHVGGSPNRSFSLAVSDGTRTVVTTVAADAGTEPATVTVTWCNGQPSAITSGNVGISLGPLTPLALPPGYKLTGTVLNGVNTDQWTAVTAWVDYTAT